MHSSPWTGALFIVVLPCPVVLLRLLAGSLDRDRIRAYIEERGGTVLDITWNPLGKGWLGSKNERIYEVRYRTGSGRQLEATCKTSMLSGVYWTGGPFEGDGGDRAGGPVECLSCGALLRFREARCPKCGWSHLDR